MSSSPSLAVCARFPAENLKWCAAPSHLRRWREHRAQRPFLVVLVSVSEQIGDEL